MSLGLNILFGLSALVAGRQLFWAFLAAAGFVLGFNVAGRWLSVQPQWLLVIIGFMLGLVGALLAVVAQRFAVAVAGFVAGGYLLLYFADLGQLAGPRVLEAVLFLAGGIIGALLLSVLLDPALIVLSAAFGAALLSRSGAALLEMGQGLLLFTFAVLFVVGIAAQWAVYQPSSTRERRN